MPSNKQSNFNKKRKITKVVNVKQIKDHNQIQIDIPKTLDNDKKINPTKIFDGYKNNKSKQSMLR